MKKVSLNGTWRLIGAGYDCEGLISGSVYSFLLDNGLMEDPFYRQNELEAVKLLENEFVFSRSFTWEPTDDRVMLHCDGLDTLCDIYINGKILNESYGNAKIENGGLASKAITLGEDEYFVLGDNRNNSADSREPSVGNISKSDIIGKAWMRIWPLNDIGFLK